MGKKELGQGTRKGKWEERWRWRKGGKQELRREEGREGRREREPKTDNRARQRRHWCSTALPEGHG